MRKRKGQVSMEFIMIFALVLFALSGFIYIVNQRLFELSKKQESLVLEHLADSIINEVIIASSSNNNYVRKFNIPYKLFGNDYRMSIDNSELYIQVLENNQTYLDYFTAFPMEVKGDFIQEITYNTTEHCVSKSSDGIRISRTQASIDVNATEINLNDEFEVLVSLHCVTDVKSARFTIKYDPEALEILIPQTKAMVLSRNEFRYRNPLFDSVLLEYEFPSGGEWINRDQGRYSYGYIGTTCTSGSGNFAKLVFKAKKAGETFIRFDQDVAENVNILDCYTNKNTLSALPDSRNNARLVIE
jgi:uncharacterized protein (UPF0333 family)